MLGAAHESATQRVGTQGCTEGRAVTDRTRLALLAKAEFAGGVRRATLERVNDIAESDVLREAA